MKNYFPPQNQNFKYLQTNRSDRLGSIWSSFNLDFQSKLGTLKLSNKLVTNTTSSDDADLGLPTAFTFWDDKWWAICGTKLFKSATNLITSAFTEDTTKYAVGDASTRFDITNPSGTTFRYTYDTTGTDPLITALTFPIGSSVLINSSNFNAGNNGTFTVTGSGSNYFEITNASGVAENDKTLGFVAGLSVSGGTLSSGYDKNSDIISYKDFLYITSGTKLMYKVNDTVALPFITLDTFTVPNSVHKISYFKKYNRLYYGNSTGIVRSIDKDGVVASSGNYYISLGSSVGYISTIVSNNSYVWIGGTSDTTDNDIDSNRLKGTISQWDGFSNQITNEFTIDAAGVLAMYVHDDIPYAIDTDGRILKYTGYSFSEIARFPIDKQLLLNATLASPRFIHFNGVVGTKNNTLLMNVNNLNENANSTINENFPSGIWELDLNTNSLTHKYSPTLKSLSSSTVTDFGQNRISSVGALIISTLQSDSVLGRSLILSGFNYYTDATTIKSGIFISSPYKPDTDTEGQKRGYFVTTWFDASDITDTWNRIWATFKKFVTSTDKIIFKYRTSEEDPTYATITWVNTTSFTTTTNVTAYVGYEVEILQGVGSGACPQIVSVTDNAGTYTVVIDNAIPGATTTTAKARFQKWNKLLPEITGQILSYGQCPITVTDTQIQIKGIMEWTGDDELHKIVLVSSDNLKSNP